MAFFGRLYTITCLVPSEAGVFKVYVGKTTCPLQKRWVRHQCNARSGMPGHLHNAIRLYGPQGFRVEELATFTSEAVLNRAEKAAIKRLRTRERDRGYNFRAGGEGGVHHKETKAKMSVSRQAFLAAHPEFSDQLSRLTLQHYEDPRLHQASSLAATRRWSDTKSASGKASAQRRFSRTRFCAPASAKLAKRLLQPLASAAPPATSRNAIE